MDPYQLAAARLIGCNPEDLLAFRWSDDDQEFIAIAPSGQKRRFTRDQLEAQLAPPPPTGIPIARDDEIDNHPATLPPKSRRARKVA